MKKYFNFKLVAILVMTLLLGLFDLPQSVQKSLPIPESIARNKIQLGLDLQGGSQLDYKIDLRSVPESEQNNIINGVKAVIEKRVNGLGVSEPNIYISDVGTEKHIIVEIAQSATITQEDIDTYLGEGKLLSDLTDDEKKTVILEKAKATVGKTIQLEFKEEKTSVDPEEKDKVKEMANAALQRINTGEAYNVVGQEESLGFPGKVKYEKSDFVFADAIPSKIKDIVTSLKPGEYKKELVETGGNFIQLENGQTVEDTGLAIVKLDETQEAVKHTKEVAASHILIAYTGAERADASVTRTEDEAYELAKEVQEKVDNGTDFAALAKQYSDDPGSKESGGKLSEPVYAQGIYAYDFEQAALALESAGDKTEKPIKTQFGYHIIKADEIKTDVKGTQYKYETITYSMVPDPWKETGLTGKHFVHADFQTDQMFKPYVEIEFNEEGAKLFEEITGRNVNKKVAIFVGGVKISAPVVNEKISGGKAVINNIATADEARNLARDLNTGAIPAPIVLSGEYTIGATLGQTALNQSLLAGIIGFLLVAIFMIFYYRLSGVIATAALGIYMIILIFLIKSQLNLGIAIVISLAVLGFMIYKILNSKDPGWEKFISFVLSCIAFFFLTFLLKTGIVLTLAGIAGIICSIGMAVDANVLIFERFKEELKEGKTFKAALDAGFDRAWNSIRDSNFSTLLTCAILYFLGSSVVKGFAINLAIGVVVSMFTAITVTKTLMSGFIGKKISENMKAFGADPEKKPTNFQFFKNSKKWLGVSGILLTIAIVATLIFNFKLGLDFTGGTLLEFNFKEPVTKEALADTLKSIGDEINRTTSNTPPTESSTSENSSIPALSSTTDTALTETTNTVDFNDAQIIPSGENGFIVKTKYLSSETHDKVIKLMEAKLPDFTEPRFTTIGPTIGKEVLKDAITAVILAVVLIVLYIAFAFRKIPKEVNPWRFGVTAIIALFHDVAMMIGLFVILGAFLDVEMDSFFITAILTVLGYSVNDTIIVFDRLREHILHSKETNLATLSDIALNQTLTRSINTTLTTILALVAILIFGHASIFYFILALTIGVFFGAYSSIFVATPLLVYWKNWKRNTQNT